MIKQLHLFLFHNYLNTTRVAAFEVELDTGELNRQNINTFHPAPKILVAAMDRDVTKFAFDFNNVRISTIFSTFEFIQCFSAVYLECGFNEIAPLSYRITHFCKETKQIKYN